MPTRRGRALESVAAPLGLSPIEAAYGVFQLAVATMTRAVKAVSTYRGRDPREFVLCGFGGNGPVVAAAIARALQMRRVLVPPSPGVFSAAGLLLSEIEHEFVRTLPVRGGSATPELLLAGFRELEAEAGAALAAEGVAPDAVAVSRYADIRYVGQAYELTLPVAAGAPDLGRIASDFGAEHHRTYGHASDAPIDVVNVKLTARAAENGDVSVRPGGRPRGRRRRRTETQRLLRPGRPARRAGDLAGGAARLAAAAGPADRRGVRRDLRRPTGLQRDARRAREHRHRPRPRP